MKSFIKFMLVILPVAVMSQDEMEFARYQKNTFDSLHLYLLKASNDSLRMDACRELGFYYQDRKYDSSLYFHQEQLTFARKLKLKLWEADALSQIGYAYIFLGNLPEGMRFLLESKTVTADPESAKYSWLASKFSGADNAENARQAIITVNHFHMGLLYGYAGDESKAFTYMLEAHTIARKIKNAKLLCLTNMSMAWYHFDNPDSAIFFFRKALEWSEHGYVRYNGQIFSSIGNIYASEGNYDTARQYYFMGIKEGKRQNNPGTLAESYYKYAIFFLDMGNTDSSLFYARKGFAISTFSGLISQSALNGVYSLLSAIYEKRGDIDSAFFYQKLLMQSNDSLNNAQKIRQFQSVSFNEELRARDREKEKIILQTRIRTYAMTAGIVVFMIIASLLYRNNMNRKKANSILQIQKEEIETRKKNLEEALSELKSTQSHLIQSEKMASLGQLTAGIAHEIQNPLNFVNNFSEVSNELVDEMNDDLSNGNFEGAKAIAVDIKQNLVKINHHGKRADAIVKGMLQHSQAGSGKKELTDINKLADEYLRLSYHGLRAKDNTFSATIKTDFDEGTGSLNIIPQDIGRVLLNLYNNAFYAVNEKKKMVDEKYEPIVSITTKKTGSKVLISVKDNGNGIPKNIVDKIFQPFFTTKPTGQGTGLGLSLAYDILKAHGGEIKVETKEGEETIFIIQLPVTSTIL